MISPTAKQFQSLLERFLEEDLSESSFIKKHLSFFKNQHRPTLSDVEFRPIENVFFALDEYPPEPELSQISEEQFRSEVREALEQLRTLDKKTSAEDSRS